MDDSAEDRGSAPLDDLTQRDGVVPLGTASTYSPHHAMAEQIVPRTQRPSDAALRRGRWLPIVILGPLVGLCLLILTAVAVMRFLG